MRMKHVCLTLALTLGVLLCQPVHPVLADAAPPWFAQGSTVNPDTELTQVQMVKENVLLTVEGRASDDAEKADLAAGYMSGRVDATFIMRNQGTKTESFDVWFPLNTATGYGDTSTVQNFQAWVDDIPAEVSEEEIGEFAYGDGFVLWATWPVTFPPSENVVLRVNYDVLPVGYRPYGTFQYVLETGAGWHGSIGEGTITVRLPYEVNSTNTVLDPASTWSTAPNPPEFSVEGTDVVWRFTDLEPTSEDNVQLAVLMPSRWRDIVAAREAVAEQPDSVEAQLARAEALEGALTFKYGLIDIGNSQEILEEAEAAYEQAAELDPDNAEVYATYAKFLWNLVPPVGPVPPETFAIVEKALELNPEDARLQDIYTWAADQSTATPTAAPTTTPPPTSTPTVTPEPSATSQPSPTSLPTPTKTPQPLPTSTPSAQGGGICPGAFPLACVALGMAWWQQRNRKRRQ